MGKIYDLRKSTLLLIWLFIAYTDCEPILVHNKDYIQCITSEPSGLAWILGSAPFVTNVILNESILWSYDQSTPLLSFQGLQCNPMKNDCVNWKGARVISNTEVEKNGIDLGIVQDYRWNDIPMNISTGETKGFSISNYIGSLKYNTSIFFHVSILAEKNGYIYLTEGNNKDTNRTYWIVLDGWNGANRRSVVRKCPGGADAYFTPDNNKNDHETQVKINNTINCAKWRAVYNSADVLQSGENWVDVTLQLYRYKTTEIDINKREALKITVKVNNTVILSWDNPYYAYNVDHLAFNTYESKRGYWKFQKYNILAPNKGIQTISSPTIKISQPNIHLCLMVTYFASAEATFRIVINNRDMDPISLKGGDKWMTEKIKVDDYFPVNCEVKIEFGFNKGTDFYLGDVRVCHQNEQFVAALKHDNGSTKNNEYKCQELKNNKSVKFPTKLEYSKIFNCSGKDCMLLCKSMFYSDCRGLVACTEKGCSCFPGFYTNSRNSSNEYCNAECSHDKFGANCLNDCGKCLENSPCNKKTGVCETGCMEEYRRPFCDTKLLILPRYDFEFLYSNENEIVIHIIHGAKSIANNDLQILPQFRELNEKTWQNATSYKFSPPINLTLQDLKSETQYQVRLVILEQDGQGYFGGSLPFINTTTTTGKTGTNTGAILTPILIIALIGGIIIGILYWKRRQNYPKEDRFKIDLNTSDAAAPVAGTSNSIMPYLRSSNEGQRNSDRQQNLPANHPETINNSRILRNSALMKRKSLTAFVQRVITKRPFDNTPTVPQENAPAIPTLVPEKIAPVVAPLEEEDIDFRAGANEIVSHPVRLCDLEEYVDQCLFTGELQRQHALFPRGQTQSWDYGRLPENKMKNRYGNLVAYDATRVKLKFLSGDPNSDYINANYIDGYKHPKAYIATQGPKENTVNDFWRMIWQENVEQIVMSTNIVESGKNKCVKYWPDVPQSVTYGDVTIQTLREDIFADYTYRNFNITCKRTTRKVEHLHFTSWPDHGVPYYPRSVAVFVKKMKKTSNPIVVHCSAGVGRTGTILLADACLRMAHAEQRVDPLAILQKMRAQRSNLVDNANQYELVHHVLLECIQEITFHIPCSSYTKEFETLLANDGEVIRKQFTKLNEISNRDILRKNNTNEFLWPENKSRNPDIAPGNYGRVILNRPLGGSDYINAVYVDGFRTKGQFIASQLPLSNTVCDLWHLVLQTKSPLVVVLNQPQPHVDQTTCIFWPVDANGIRLPDNSVLQLKRQTTPSVFNHLRLEYLSGEQSDENCHPHEVHMLMLNGWESGAEVPSSAYDLIQLWEEAERLYSGHGPIIVLCHDGAQGCGLFLSSVFVIEKMKLEKEVDVGLAVRTSRLTRPHFITSLEQFAFLHQVALTYQDSFENYANFH